MIQASQIREHMQVLASDGQTLGSVERLDGSSRLKLARPGMPGAPEQFIPLDWIATVEGQTLRLSKSSHDVREAFERSGTPRTK